MAIEQHKPFWLSCLMTGDPLFPGSVASLYLNLSPSSSTFTSGVWKMGPFIIYHLGVGKLQSDTLNFSVALYVMKIIKKKFK